LRNTRAAVRRITRSPKKQGAAHACMHPPHARRHVLVLVRPIAHTLYAAVRSTSRSVASGASLACGDWCHERDAPLRWVPVPVPVALLPVVAVDVLAADDAATLVLPAVVVAAVDASDALLVAPLITALSLPPALLALVSDDDDATVVPVAAAVAEDDD